MSHQLVDQILKTMAEYHADEFIRLAFPQADFRVVSAKLEKEVIFKTKIVDTVIKILVDNQEHLVHFEFQTRYDPKIAERIFIYAGVLTAKYNLDVTSVLFQLRPPPSKMNKLINSYRVNLFGTVTNTFRFHCVRLWEFYDEIVSGKKEYLGFVPLLSELAPKPDKALLIQQRKLIHKEENLERKSELLGLCLTLASRHFSFNDIKNIFEEDLPMLEALEEVPYIGEKIKKARSEGREQGLKDGLIEGMQQGMQQGMQKGMQQGMQKGMQQGMQQGIRNDIIELLENRFQSVDGIKAVIDSITEIEQLKTIFRLAIKAESLEVFKELIAKMKSS